VDCQGKSIIRIIHHTVIGPAGAIGPCGHGQALSTAEFAQDFSAQDVIDTALPLVVAACFDQTFAAVDGFAQFFLYRFVEFDLFGQQQITRKLYCSTACRALLATTA
jgi:hypothetical protein